MSAFQDDPSRLNVSSGVRCIVTMVSSWEQLEKQNAVNNEKSKNIFFILSYVVAFLLKIAVESKSSYTTKVVPQFMP